MIPEDYSLVQFHLIGVENRASETWLDTVRQAIDVGGFPWCGDLRVEAVDAAEDGKNENDTRVTLAVPNSEVEVLVKNVKANIADDVTLRVTFPAYYHFRKTGETPWYLQRRLEIIKAKY